MIRLLKYAKSYQKYIYVGTIAKFIEAIFELFLPFLLARLIDFGINANDVSYIYRMGIFMLGLSILGIASALVCQYSASVASQGFGTILRDVLMKKINSFSHKEMDDYGSATLTTRVTNDVNQLQLALAMLIRLVVRAPFLSIGAVVMAVYINPRLSLIFAVLLPIFAIILGGIMWLTVPLYRKVQVKLDDVAKNVGENMSGVRVIRAFARRRYEQERSTQNSGELSNANILVNNVSALMAPSTTLVMNMGIMFILYIGANLTNNGDIFQGEVLALINYMNQMLLALMVVANLVVIFTKSQASAIRINGILDQEIPLKDPESPNKISDHGNYQNSSLVEFKEVSFKYYENAANALTDIDFSLNQGEILGITGPTGSGKSTLVQLIPRFYDIDAGEITVFNEKVTDVGLIDLRNRIGYVPQRNLLFKGTIRENLSWADEEASEEDLMSALAIAQMDEFVLKLPEGLDSKVEENGKNFSGGQQQRLTIARALVGSPEILILDDSLSALDYETDSKLRQALSQLESVTSIIVSQRISSIQQADQILVMNNGLLEAKGSHEDLLEVSKTYQEIVESQMDSSSEEQEGE